MNRIIIDYPDDCTETEAVVYASGAFNPSQLDYRAVLKGYTNGVGFQFGDGRNGYFYCTLHGNYVLKLESKEDKSPTIKEDPRCWKRM